MILLDRVLAMARMILKAAFVGALVGIIAGLVVGSILWVGIEWPRGLTYGDIARVATLVGAVGGVKIGCLVALFRVCLRRLES